MSDSALLIMSDRLNVDPMKLLGCLRSSCFKGATDEEMLALLVVANTYKLNPLARQIYAFPSRGGIVPVVSVDGWLHILNEQENFDGMEFEYSDDENGNPVSITAIVHRKDRSHPTRVTEYFSECFRNTEPWKQFPRRMLRHKSIKEVARVAFSISGVTDEDEARDMDKNSVREVKPQRPLFAPAAKEGLPHDTELLKSAAEQE